MRKNVLIFLSTLTFLLVVTACQIGLGPAVDTEAPEVEFSEYPQTDAKIRGEFTLGGKWSDDGVIKKVLVRLTNLSSKVYKDYTYTSTAAENGVTCDKDTGKWSCSINPEAEGLKDGTYEAKVEMTDTYGHKTTITRTFVIDNTAPVLVLSRPTYGIGSSSFDSYGQEFSVEGYVGESTDKKYVNIEIYADAEGKECLYSVKGRRVDSEFSITVAQKDSSENSLKGAESETLDDVYSAIYGSESEGTQKRYIKVQAYDEAMYYGSSGSSEPEGDNAVGNLSEYFYLYDDLYDSVFQTYGSYDIYKMESGASGEDEEKTAEILAVLGENRISEGQFSINPANNPSFIVSGKNTLKMDGTDFDTENEDYHITNGSTVVVEISPGLDETPLDGDTLGVYAVECDEYGNAKDGAEKVTIIPAYKDSEGNVLISSEEEIKARDESRSTSGTTYKFKAKLVYGNGLKLGTSYLFGVYGCDKNGIEVKNLEGTYGFVFTSSVSPKVTISEPAGMTTYIKKDAVLTVAGKTVTEIGEPKLTFTINDKEVEVPAGISVISGKTTDEESGKVTCSFSFDIPSSEFTEETEEYVLGVSAYSGGLETEVTKNIIYDTEAPSVEITTPAEGEWLGATGAVEVGASFRDNLSGVDRIYYSTTKTEFDSKNTEGWSELGGSSSIYRGSKLLSVSGEGKNAAEISFVVIDRAENVSETATRWISVDLSSPVLTDIEYSTDGGSTENEVYDEEGKAGTIILKKNTYTISGKAGDTGSDVTVKVTRDGSEIYSSNLGKTGEWSVTEEKVADGSHKYAVSAEDESGKKVEKEFTVVSDVTAPTGAVNHNISRDDTKLSSCTFTGTASDGTSGSGISEVKLTITDAADETKSQTVLVDGTENWSQKVSYSAESWKKVFEDEGEKKVKVSVTDKAGNVYETTDEGAYTFIYDKSNPELNVVSGSSQSFMTSEGFDYEGTASDTYKLNTLVIKETKTSKDSEGNFVTAVKSAVVKDFAGSSSGSWKVHVPLSDSEGETVSATDGTYKYEFTLTDGNGNEPSSSKVYEVTVDTTAPVIQITVPAADTTKIGKNAVSEASYKFSGSVEEENGIKGIWYKVSGKNDETPGLPEGDKLTAANWTDSGWKSADAGSTSFKVTEDFISGNTISDSGICEGEWKLCVCAVDEAGNVSEEAVRFFDVDMADPELISSITTDDNCKLVDGIYYFKGENISGFYTANDTNGVASVVLKTGEYSEALSPAAEDTEWTLEKALFADGKQANLTFTVTDKAGKSSEKTLKVCFDKTAPEVSITAPAKDTLCTGNSVTIKASVKDNGVGLNTIRYSIDNGATWSEEEILEASASAWTKEITMAEQGTKQLKLWVTDLLGNESTTAATSFYYDEALPEVTADAETEKLISAARTYFRSGSTIELKGSAFDTNELVGVTIIDEINGNKTTYSTENNGNNNNNGITVEYAAGTDSISQAKSSDSAITWSKTLSAGDLVDGTHTITITATDTAGRTNSLEITAIVDTVLPTVSNTAFTTQALYLDVNKYNTLNAEAADATSGIASVYYLITDSAETPAADDSNWVRMNQGSGNWTSTMNLGDKDDGNYYGYIKAVDNAGNIGITEKENAAELLVDRIKPVIAITSGRSTSKGEAVVLSVKVTDTNPGVPVASIKVPSGGRNIAAVVSTDAGYYKTDGSVTTYEAKDWSYAQWSVTVPLSAEATGGIDGNYEVTFMETDESGREADEVTYTILRDTQAPAVSFNTIDSYKNVTRYTFGGRVTDANSVNVQAELYKAGISAENTQELAPDGNGSWSWTVSDLSDGEYTIKVTATDIAGNTTVAESEKLTVDLTLPENTINSTGLYTSDGSSVESSVKLIESSKYYAKGSFTISGTIKETNYDSSKVTISAKKGSENITAAALNFDSTDTRKWSFNSTPSADGEYTYTIKVTDLAGNQTSSTVNIVYDTTAPKITIKSPVTDEKTGLNAINQTNDQFSGIVSDDSGIAAVWYKIASNSESAPVCPENDKLLSSTEWLGNGWTKATNQLTTWNFYQTFKEKGKNGNGLEEGSYILYVYAVDTAGNVSDSDISSGNQAATVLFDVDMNKPELSDLSLSADTTKYFAGTSLTVSGKVTDTNALSSKNCITITSGSGNTLKTLAKVDRSSLASDGSWTVTLYAKKDNQTLISPNEITKIKITATDTVGKTLEESRNIYYDTKAPEIDSISIKEGDLITSLPYTVNLSVRDEGSGVAYLTYKLSADDEGNSIFNDSSNADWQAEIEVTELEEGNHQLMVYVTDVLGNTTSSPETVNFTYDISAPELTETDLIGSIVNAETLGSGITLSGTAYDTNGLKSVTIIDEINGNKTTYSTENNGNNNNNGITVEYAAGTDSISQAKSSDSAITWSKTLSAGDLVDGTHTITITATDKAGRISAATKAVTVDKTAPAATQPVMPGKEDTKASSYTFTGTASDATSGIDKIELTITDSDDSTKTKTVLVDGTTNWSKRVTFGDETLDENGTAWADIFAAEGVKTVTVKATDKAGNTYTTASQSFTYDKADPVLNIKNSSVQEYTNDAGYTITGSAADSYKLGTLTVKETKTVNGTSSSTSRLLKDSASSVDGEKWNSGDKSGNWSVAVPLSGTPTDGNVYEYEFILTDKNGNEISTFNLVDDSGNSVKTSSSIKSTVDTSRPEITFTNLGGYTKGQSLPFSGTITEAHLKSAEAVLQKWDAAGNSGAGAWVNSAISTTLQPSQNGSWNWTVYEGISEDGNYRINVTAEDYAGLIGEEASAAITVDRTAPDTTIEIDGSGKLYDSDGVEVTTVEFGKTYYANAAVELTGTIIENNLTVTTVTNADGSIKYRRNVTLKVNNSETESPELGGTGARAWSFSPLNTNDGTYQYDLTITDDAGNSTTRSIVVVRDTTPPVLSFDYPNNAENINASTLSANGKVTENGIGIADNQIYYSTNADSAAPTWTALTYASGNKNWSQNLTIPAEGSVKLTLKAADKLGNSEISANYPYVTFNYDKALPTLTTVDLGKYTNDNFAISGTASDSNNISRVEVINDATNEKYTYTFSDDEKAALKAGYNAETGTGLVPQNWSISFKVGTGNAAESGYLADGSYSFTVNLYDAAERMSSKAVSIIVDTVSPEVTSIPVPDLNETESSSYKFIGETSDATTNVTEVWVTFTPNPDFIPTAANAIKASGTTNWIYNCIFDSVSQLDADGKKIFASSGNKTIYVRAKDAAENWSSWTSENFVYDTAKPDAEIAGFAEKTGDSYGSLTAITGNSFGTSKVFKLSGTISDDWGFDFTKTDSLKITQTKDGAEIDVTALVSKTLDAANTEGEKYNWTISGLPVKKTGDNYETLSGDDLTGNYKYTISVTDKTNTISGNTNKKTDSQSVTCIIDVSAPAVEITTPAASLGKSKYISDENYTFYGKANDVGSAGVDRIYYKFTRVSDDGIASTPDSAETSPSIWESETASNGNWSIEKSISEGTNDTYLSDGKVCEGKWYFFFQARDASGNYSNIISRYFWIDKNLPEISVTTVPAASTNQTISIAGRASDTSKLSGVTITDSLNSSFSKQISSFGADGSWSAEIELDNSDASNTKLKDGNHTLKITATDIIGRTAVVSESVITDTTKPTIGSTIGVPAGKDFDGSITFSGTANDSVPSSDLNKVTVQFADNSDLTNAANKTEELAAAGTASWNYQIENSMFYTPSATPTDLQNVFGDSEGQKYVFVKAYDKAGNISDVVSKGFIYDKSAPALTVNYKRPSDVTAAALADKASLTFGVNSYELSGTFADTGSNVEISVTRDNVSAGTVSVKNASEETVTNGTVMSGSWSLSQSGIADGTHNYVVTATDASGRNYEIKFTILVDITAPTVSFTSVMPGADDTKGSNYTFTGNSSDDTSGVEEVKLTITDGSDSGKTYTATASGKEVWSSKVTFADFGEVFKSNDGTYVEGDKKVKVTVTDKAGNSTTSNELTFTYDRYDPVLKVTESSVQEFMSTSGFTLSGTATDSLKLGTLKINETKTVNGTSSSTSRLLKDSASSVDGEKWNSGDKSGNWSVAVPLSGTPTDGAVYKYEFILTDKAGHEITSSEYTVDVDLTAPTIEVTSPSADEYKNVNSYTFKGKITEAHIDSAKISLYKDDGATAVKTEELQLGTPVNNVYTWNWTATDLSEGKYTVKVEASDLAGNSANTSSTKYVYYDKTVPVIAAVTTTLHADDGSAVSGNISENNNYYANAGFTISPVITEDHYASEKVTLTATRNGTTISAPAMAETAAGSKNWSFTTTPASDGTYVYTVTVTDLAGNIGTASYTVIFDSTAPDVSLTSPVAGYISDSSSITLTGSVSDSGIGLKSLKYSVDSGENWNDVTLPTGTSSWSTTYTASAEGTINLKVKAVDKLDNTNTTNVRTVYYDQGAPVLTKNDPTGGSTVNEAYYLKNGGTLTLSGTAYDTNELKNITISDVNDSNAAVTYTDAVIKRGSIVVGISTAKSEAAKITWTKELTAATLGNGTHTITVTAEDTAGRKTSANYEVIVDTNAPRITAVTCPTVYETANSSFTFTGNASDTGGSSLRYIYFGLADKSGDSDLTDSSKFTQLTGSTVWAYTLEKTQAFTTEWTAEGEKTVYVYAEDTAGNISSTAFTKTFKYDTSSPELKTFGIKDGSSFDLTSSEPSLSTGKVFSLTGNVFDNWEVESVTVTENTSTAIAADKIVLGSSGQTKTLTISGLPTVRDSTDNTKPQSGNYTYTLNITDKAGKLTTKNIKISIDVDAPVPTISAPTSAAVADRSLSATDYTFRGGVTDAGVSGMKALYYAITTSATVPTQAVTDTSVWTKLTQTTQDDWSFIKYLGAGTSGDDADTIYEGQHYLYVKGEDNAGNITSDADANTAKVAFYVDKAAPEISDATDKNSKALTENATFYYDDTTADGAAGKFTLSGKILESNGLKTLKYAIDDGTAAEFTTKPAPSNTKAAWSQELTGITADASHKVVITAQDNAERTAVSSTYYLYRDTAAPVITITNPDANVDGTSALSWTGDDNGSYTLRANVSDAGSGISGNKYKYWVTQTVLADAAAIKASAKETEDNKWTEYTGGQSFTKALTLVTGTTDTTNIHEGKWYVYLYAIDSVGHETVASRCFWVDKTAPTVNVSFGSSIDTLSSIPTTADTGAKIYISATDTQGLDTTYGITDLTDSEKKIGIQVAIENSNGTSVTPSVAKDETGYYFTLPATPSDGIYTCTVTAKDPAGKTTSVTRSLRLDTTGPALATTSPTFTNGVSGWQTSRNISVLGTASDDTEVSKIYYALDKTVSLPASADAKTTAKWTEKNWTELTGASNWTIPLTAVTDSAEHHLYLSAVDKYGNMTAIITKTLKVDSTVPALDETSVGLTGKTFNAADKTNSANVTISGTFSDATSGITSMTIEDDKNSFAAITIAKDDVTNGNWSTEVAVSSLSDGVHTITITGTDAAGNASSVQRSVVVDTQAPGAGSFTVADTNKSADYFGAEASGASDTNAQAWYTSSTNTITVKGISDTASNSYASGIASVDYSTNASADTPVWIGMTQDASTSTTYTASVTCPSQGANTITVRIKDAVGNITTKSTTIYVDTEKPAIPTSYTVTYGGVAHENYTDQLVISGRSSATVTLNPTDGGSGIKEIAKGTGTTASKAGTPTNGVYTIEVSSANLTNGACSFTITDKMGNSTTWSPFTILVDSTPPTVTMIAPEDADDATPGTQVNGTITLEGRAKDTGGSDLKQIDVCYATSDDASSWKHLSTITTDLNNWSVAKVDTTSAFGTLADGSTVYICAIVTDGAGNRNTDTTSGSTVTDNTKLDGTGGTTGNLIPTQKPSAIAAANIEKVIVNQDTDRPRITFTTISLTGMGKTTTGEGASAKTTTTYAYLKNTKKLIGLIEDDDGISSFKYSTDYADKTANSEDPTWTSITPSSSGAFTIDNLPEGASTVYFQVTDTGKFGSATTNTVFTSSGSGSTGPKLVGSGGEAVTADTILYLRVNTDAPEISNVKLYRFDLTSGASGAYEETAKALVDLSASYVLGGTRYNKFKVVLDAADENGVDSVKIYKSSDYNDETENHTPTPLGDVSNESNTFTIKDIPVDSLNSGSNSFTIVATDSGELEKTKVFEIQVDTTAPTMRISSHTSGATIRTNFTLKGSVDDAGATMKYLINSSAAAVTDFSSAKTYTVPEGASISAWDITFDGDTNNAAEMHDDDQKTYFVKLYGTKDASGTNYGIVKNSSGTIVEKCSDTCEGNDSTCSVTHTKYTTKKPFYYHFQLTDALGNVGYDDSFNLLVDPQGDIPVITMISPRAESYAYYSETGSCWAYVDPSDFVTGTAYDSTKSLTVKVDNVDTTYADFKYKGLYTSASGRINITGSAEDDKTIKGLYIQIDPTYEPTDGFTWVGSTDTCPAGGASGITIASHYTVEDIYDRYNGTAKGITGIYIGNDTSWSIKLNQYNEFNGSGTNNNTIAVKLIAVDEDGNIYQDSNADAMIITIDSGAPQFGETTKTTTENGEVTTSTVGVNFAVWQFAWTNVTSGVTSTVYTNTSDPTTSSKAYSDSGCTAGETAITAVDAENNTITAGDKVYTAAFITRTYEDDMWLSGKWWLKGSVEDESGISSVKMKIGNATNSVSILDDYCTTASYIVDTQSGNHDYLVCYPIGNTTENAYGSLTYTLEIQDVGTSSKDNSKTFSINYDNKAPTLAGTSDANFNIDTAVANTEGFYTFGSAVTEGDGESGFARAVVYFKRTTEGHQNIYDVFLPKTSSEIAYSSLHEEDGLYWQTAAVTAITNHDASLTSTLTVTTSDNVHAGGIVKFGGVIYTITAKDTTTITINGTPSTTLSGSTAYFAIGAVIDRKGTENSPSTTKTNGYYSSDAIGGDYDCMIEKITTQGTKTIWEGNINTKNIYDGPIEIHYVVYDKAGNCSHDSVTKNAKTNKDAFVQNNAPMIASVTVATNFSGTKENNAYIEEYSDTYYVSEKTRKIGGKEYQKSINVSNDVTVANGSKGFMEVKGYTWVKPEIVGGNGALSYTYKISDYSGTQLDASTSATSLGVSASVEGGEEYLNAEDQNEAKYVSGQTLTMPITTDMLETATTSGNSTLEAPTSFFFTIMDSTEGTTSGLSATMDVKLAVNYYDQVGPKVAVKPFFWNSHSDNSLYQNSYKNGHIELKEDTDDNPDVSGTISIRGSAFDDHKLSSIWVKFDDFTPASGTYSGDADSGYYKVASYEDGEWTSYANPNNATSPYTVADNKWAFSVTKDYFNQNGQKVNWQLDIDTSAISGAMGDNKNIYVKAIDAATTPNSSSESAATTSSEDNVYNKPSYTMDVVPYISEVDSVSNAELSGTTWAAKNGMTITYTSASRSRLGRYPVQAGQPIALKGFNFGNGDITVTKTIGSTKKGTTNESWTPNATRIDANTIIISAPSYSGYVNLEIGGTKASNNQSSTAHGWNIVEGYDASDKTTYGAAAAAKAGTNFWTDDVYLSVWKSGDSFANASNPISGSIVGLTSTSNVYTTAREAKTFAANTIYGIWGSNDNMMYNEVFGTGTNQNTRWYILSPQASGAFRSPPSETDSCIVNNNVFHTWLDDGWADATTFGNGLQLVRDGETAATDSSYIEKTSADKVRHQFQNIKIAGAYKNSKYYMYVTYYDSYTKCLKYGMMEFRDSWDTNRSSQEQTVCRADSAGSYVIDGYDAADNTSLSWDVGEFSAVKIDNSGTTPIPVVSYYDKKNGVLKIARGGSTAPVSKRYGGSVGTGADTTPWTYTTVTSPSGCSDFGRYVSMEMDSAGNLHIAAQDVTNGILYYGMFTKGSDGTYSISGSWQAVDATSSVGRWNDIKLTNASGTTTAECKPVITYQNASRLNTTSAVKIAYIDDSGNWEAITDASAYESQDAKLSLVIGGLDKSGNSSKYAIGINSTEFAVDFLRGEQ